MGISWAVGKTKSKQRSTRDYEGMSKRSRGNDSRGQLRTLVKGTLCRYRQDPFLDTHLGINITEVLKPSHCSRDGRGWELGGV